MKTVWVLSLVVVGCGASPSLDAGVDAGLDAGLDAGVDAGLDAGQWSCSPDGGEHRFVRAPLDGPDGGFEPNDVSFLFPLPTPSERSALLAVVPALVSDAMLAALPTFTSLPSDAGTLAESLRVVAVRVDPCAPPAGDCHPQLRLVAQPLFTEPGAPTTMTLVAGDEALHLVYDVPPAEFPSVLAELKALRPLAHGQTGGRLRVHPVMAAEGLSGPYATAVRALIARVARRDWLSALATSRLSGFMEWELQRFAAQPDGGLAVEVIPRLAPATRQLVGLAFRPDPVTGNSITRLPRSPVPTPDLLGPLLEWPALDRTAFEPASAELTRLLDPTRSDSRTDDCGSCHRASNAANTAARACATGGAWVPLPIGGRFDLRFPSDAASGRALGYVGRTPEVSLRTAVESARIADHLAE